MESDGSCRHNVLKIISVPDNSTASGKEERPPRKREEFHQNTLALCGNKRGFQSKFTRHQEGREGGGKGGRPRGLISNFASSLGFLCKAEPQPPAACDTTHPPPGPSSTGKTVSLPYPDPAALRNCPPKWASQPPAPSGSAMLLIGHEHVCAACSTGVLVLSCPATNL